eukprot:327011_1
MSTDPETNPYLDNELVQNFISPDNTVQNQQTITSAVERMYSLYKGNNGSYPQNATKFLNFCKSNNVNVKYFECSKYISSRKNNIQNVSNTSKTKRQVSNASDQLEQIFKRRSKTKYDINKLKQLEKPIIIKKETHETNTIDYSGRKDIRNLEKAIIKINEQDTKDDSIHYGGRNHIGNLEKTVNTEKTAQENTIDYTGRNNITNLERQTIKQTKKSDEIVCTGRDDMINLEKPTIKVITRDNKDDNIDYGGRRHIGNLEKIVKKQHIEENIIDYTGRDDMINLEKQMIKKAKENDEIVLTGRDDMINLEKQMIKKAKENDEIVLTGRDDMINLEKSIVEKNVKEIDVIDYDGRNDLINLEKQTVIDSKENDTDEIVTIGRDHIGNLEKSIVKKQIAEKDTIDYGGRHEEEDNQYRFNINIFSQQRHIVLRQQVTKKTKVWYIKQLYKEQTEVKADINHIHFYCRLKEMNDNRTLEALGITDERHVISVQFMAQFANVENKMQSQYIVKTTHTTGDLLRIYYQKSEQKELKDIGDMEEQQDNNDDCTIVVDTTTKPSASTGCHEMKDNENDYNSIVIDNGSYCIKAGFAGEYRPRKIFPSVGNGYDRIPIKHGIVTNWDDMQNIWHQTFYNKLKINPQEYTVLLTEVPMDCNRDREKVAEIMFETFNVPGICFANTAELSLLASGRKTGIILDIGGGVTSVTPIYNTYNLEPLVKSMDFAGRELTQFLTELLPFSVDKQTVRDIKEKHCYVAENYERESQATNNDIEYELPSHEIVRIGVERFKCCESLFNTSLVQHRFESMTQYGWNPTLRYSGIHTLLYKTIQDLKNMKCPVDITNKLYSNIILSGGCTMFEGIEKRLEVELKRLVGNDVPIKIISPSMRKFSAWHGGSKFASLSEFNRMWTSRNDYYETGASSVRQKKRVKDSTIKQWLGF